MDDHFHQLGRPKVRVTVRVGDEVVARSERMILLKEFAHDKILDPVYYFPQDDVAMDKLRPTETRTHCPIKGDAAYWTYSGDAGAEEDRVLDDGPKANDRQRADQCEGPRDVGPDHHHHDRDNDRDEQNGLGERLGIREALVGVAVHP